MSTSQQNKAGKVTILLICLMMAFISSFAVNNRPARGKHTGKCLTFKAKKITRAGLHR